jgi:hypothetical protein
MGNGFSNCKRLRVHFHCDCEGCGLQQAVLNQISPFAVEILALFNGLFLLAGFGEFSDQTSALRGF